MHAVQVAASASGSGGCADANDTGPQEWSRMLLKPKDRDTPVFFSNTLFLKYCCSVFFKHVFYWKGTIETPQTALVIAGETTFYHHWRQRFGNAFIITGAKHVSDNLLASCLGKMD